MFENMIDKGLKKLVEDDIKEDKEIIITTPKESYKDKYKVIEKSKKEKKEKKSFFGGFKRRTRVNPKEEVPKEIKPIKEVIQKHTEEMAGRFKVEEKPVVKPIMPQINPKQIKQAMSMVSKMIPKDPRIKKLERENKQLRKQISKLSRRKETRKVRKEVKALGLMLLLLFAAVTLTVVEYKKCKDDGNIFHLGKMECEKSLENYHPLSFFNGDSHVQYEDIK